MNTELATAGSIFNPLGGAELLQIVAIVVFTWLLLRLIRGGLPWLAERGPGRTRMAILASIPLLRLGLLLLALLWIIPIVLQPTLSNLVAVLGVAGLAIGFAFKDYVSSLIAGIVSIYERPYRVGDWVRIGDAYGEVKSIDMRAMRLRTPDDTLVSVPHAQLWTDAIHNDTDGAHELMCVTSLYLAPGHDGERVRSLLLDIAYSCPLIQLERPVTVIVAHCPWGLHYRIKCYPLDSRDQYLLNSELTLRAQAALATLGIELVAATPAAADGRA